MTEEEKTKAMIEEEHKIMAGYMDTAKTFTQLSIGALILSITFLEKILGITGKISVPYLLLFAWLFWLLAALAGAFYQYRAIKWLEGMVINYNIIQKRHHAIDPLKIYPYQVYGFLLVCFFLGTIFFAIFGAMKILSS
ncbi:hypothetical protein [Hanamia caeni]|jgi:hypothetical protein|nr:hypothetical protein [Hanamia caeni]